MVDPVRQAVAIDEGRRIVVGVESGRVLEFPASDPTQAAAFTGLEGKAIESLAVSADGALILAFDAEGRGLAWDRARRERIDELRSAEAVIQCAAAGPGDYVTLEYSGTGQVWSRTGDALQAETICDPPESPLWFRTFGLSGDGRRLTLIDGFRWRVWDRASRTVTASQTPIHGLEVDYLSGEIGVSANGRFYFVYWDTYMVMDTSDGSVVREHQIAVTPACGSLSNDGRILAVGAEDGVVLGAGADGETVFEERLGAGAILQVSVGAEGRLAAFVDKQGGAGCVDLERGTVLIGRERMAEIVGNR